MIRTLFSNFLRSKDFKGTFSEKASMFLALTRLQAKAKLFKTENAIVHESLFNYKVFGYNYWTINYLINEVFNSNEYFFQPTNGKPLVVDCGANIGMSVLYFKKLYPDSKIIAFEANPHVFKLLERNVQKNNIKNVELFNIALYDQETVIPFYINHDFGTMLGSIKSERGGTTEFKIQAQKLSHFLKEVKYVDLVKMDVEGAEWNIVNDLVESSTINRVNEYIIEYHHNMNEDKSALASFLQKFETNGFSYNIKANYGEINCFQDVLIHFYKK